MTWLKRAAADPHECHPPMRQAVIDLPSLSVFNPGPARRVPVPLPVVDGRHGDLWRCGDCGKTYRVGVACNICDAYGPRPHSGQHAVGLRWRRASWWQTWRRRR